MRTKFENRGGEVIELEMTTADPCPECCGGLERMATRSGRATSAARAAV